MDQTASNINDTLKKYEGKTKQVAFNPSLKIWETVWPEDGVSECETITMYWVESHQRYVTIPE